MITVDLQLNADELEELRSITETNLNNILDYTGQGTLEFTLAPFHKELLMKEEPSVAVAHHVYFTLRDLLQQGGRILLLAPDSQPQELTLEQEA